MRSVWWENTTYSLQHARMVTGTIVSLLSYLFFCLSSGAIVSCNQQRFNDRNLVLLNSAAWADTDAKTFLELVVFPSWLLYFTLLLFSLFSLLFPPHLSLVLLKVTVNVRDTERENASGMDRFILKFCSLLSFFLACLCVRVLNAQRKAVYSAVQSGLRNTMYIPVMFSLLNKPRHFTTPNYHSLHVKVSIHSLIRTYLMSFLHFLPPFVSNPAIVEFGTTQRMQR